MNNRIRITEKGMSIIFWNIQSIYPKIDAIRLIVEELKPDIMCFSETWLNHNIDNSDVHIEGYTMSRNDRKSLNVRGNLCRGGGVCIYVLAKYKFDVIDSQLNVSSSDVETITIKLNLKDTRPIYITNVYRPPSGDLKKCISYLNDLLEFIDQTNNCERYFGGDFNINYISKSTQTSELKKLMAKNTLRQIITEPTRIATKETLLDLILTDSDYIKFSGVLDINISDHLPVFILRKKVKVKSPKCEFKGRVYRNYNKDTLSAKLNQLSWDEFYMLNDVNGCWQIIIDRITVILDELCPIKTFSFSKEKQPWMDQELLNQLANRDEAIRVARRTGHMDDLVYARRIRNRTKALVNKAKVDFYTNQLNDNKDDPRKYWQQIYTVLNKNKNENRLNIEDDNGNVLEHEYVPEFINNFFTTIGAKLVKDNPKMKYNFVPPVIVQNINPFQLQEIQIDQLLVLLKQIKVHKSSGLDNISSMVLKDALMILSSQILYIINMSIRTNRFPDSWKRGTVIPLPKVNNPTKVGDLRPITLLPIPSKIIEKIVYNQLMNYLENNKYMSDNQFGFRKNKSTIDAAFKFVNDLYSNDNKKLITSAIFIDYKKAFDSNTYTKTTQVSDL